MSTPEDSIRELLGQQAAKLAAKAANGDAVSAEEVEAIGRIARLLEIRDAARPKTRRAWWPAVTLGGSLAIATVLLFVRVPATDIELECAVSELRFVTERSQVIAAPLRLSALGASGLREIQIPNTGKSSYGILPSLAQGARDVRLFKVLDLKFASTLTLAPIVLPGAATVILRASESAKEFALLLLSPDLSLRVDGYGPLMLRIPGSAPTRLDLPSPRPIILRTGAEEAELDLSFPSTPSTPFSPQIDVRDLLLSRIEQFIGTDQTLIQRLSTIRSGSLLLESLNGEEHKLRPGEELRFEESHGEILQMRLEDNQIGLRYHGRVRGMTTGFGEGLRSLMPTYLEWMRARHGLSLLWGSALYTFGLFAGFLRWWGVRS